LVLTAVTCSLAAQQKAPTGKGGFVDGLPGYEHFHDPVGQPIYFESARNDTQIRPIYLHHKFSDGSIGGSLDVYAVQARLALTERLGFIATKDGYSNLNSNALPDDTGWNSLAAGFKYVLVDDREHDFLITPGFRVEAENGSRAVLQGGVPEFSPFLSFAKGFDQLHLMGNITYRKPLDDDDGNDILHLDLHVDCDLAPKALPGFAPCVEAHSVSYLTNGTALGTPFGGLDYANLGASDVKGSFVAWAGIGARYEIPGTKVSLGGVYEFALTDPDKDIMDQRFTFDVVFRF
jgi:hypothetical protein